MKRVKSDQIVYNQEDSPPLVDSTPIEEGSPPIPLSPTIEESSSVRSRKSLEEELGLSAADADAINQLTRTFDDEPLPNLTKEPPSAITSPPESLTTGSPLMDDPPVNSVPVLIVPSELAESPAVVPPPTTSTSSPVQHPTSSSQGNSRRL
ncbi:hypothetical protein PGT21_013117 [Puccinia graminis f. sp. tritici]|uniref:Uncharacterized protein n=1 Tax=Puccinia graminis f. sp. tritici TaxID=56615 RepID=A0A5B0NPA6_PUCGR|nr:hypothetical protein PGT21_013117 [Puccinia graminis f. sp. tritici]KAA1089920.1 hypothetical protein PGTUg99_030109 [Puccinia graminis f. sp. tritici]